MSHLITSQKAFQDEDFHHNPVTPTYPKKDYDKMKDCKNYSTCSAPLCPPDPDATKRPWYVGVDVTK
jgi:hypothetical protein